jgi:hypothetical protein
MVCPGGLVVLRPGATFRAEVPCFLRWPGAMPDAPGLVLPVVDARFVVECMIPVAAPLDPVVEFVMPVLEPVVLWADAADATATTNPAAEPMPMRFMVYGLLVPSFLAKLQAIAADSDSLGVTERAE